MESEGWTGQTTVEISSGTVTHSIAGWASNLTYSEIPPDVVETSKLHILDTIGIGVAGAADEIGLIARRWLANVGSGSVSVLAAARKVGPTDAALANGLAMHALDFDGGTFGGHPSPCLLPTILAAAEPSAVDGETLIRAYVAAMEVFGRFGLATNHEAIHYNGFHPTTVFGMIAATVGAGLILGLDENQLADAVALAASSGAGLTANFGSMAKPLHAGNVASSAVRVAQLAAAGMYGNPAVLESNEGFQTAYMRNQIDWDKYLSGLGNPLRLSFAPPGIKQYPTCGGNQRAVENVASLVAENSISVDQIDRIDVTMNPDMMRILRYDWPSNQYEAKFSLKYNVAVAAVHGRPTIASYREPVLSEPAVREVGAKVRVLPTGVGNRSFSPVEIRLTDGRTISTDRTLLPGSPDAPLGRDAVVAKFLACCAGVISAGTADQVRASVLSLESAGSESDFWKLWKNLGAEISADTASAG
jgi:2-methylcitrate dehydratase PrpD